MDALQITFYPPPLAHQPTVRLNRGFRIKKKNLFPAFEKIKSIFDNGESITGSFSQQALLPTSRFSGEEATISDKAERALWAPGEQKASRCSRLLVRNGPWRCHAGTMRADKLPPWKKRDVLLIFNYIHNAALTWREKLAMCGGEQTHSTPPCLWEPGVY